MATMILANLEGFAMAAVAVRPVRLLVLRRRLTLTSLGPVFGLNNGVGIGNRHGTISRAARALRGPLRAEAQLLRRHAPGEDGAANAL